MIHIQVNEDIEELWESLDVPFDALEDAAEEALYQTEAAGDAELTIVLGSDELLQTMNQKYLEIDAPTDVLSFSADFTDPDTEANYLGDIIISVPRAASQAEASAHPLQDELQLLVVHGVLHLMEYDHAEPDEKPTMQEMQDAILKALGSSPGPVL
jgi:probable rRNA maturation factor